MLTGHANFCCMPIPMQKHSAATPSITSEQILDDRHEKKSLHANQKLKTKQKCPQLLSHVLGEALKYRIS